MRLFVLIILTDDHKGLYESIATTKSGQFRFFIDIAQYDMSYCRNNPILPDDFDRVKKLIEFYLTFDGDKHIYVIGDKNQTESIVRGLKGKYSKEVVYVENGELISLSE